MSKLSAEERAHFLSNVAKTTRLIERRDSIPAYRMRAFALSALGRKEEALADFTKIIELAPDSDAYRNRADLYAALKRDKQAIADYTRAIELKPNEPHWYTVRGKFYLERGHRSKALADYAKAVELAPYLIIPLCPPSFKEKLDEHRLIGYTRAIELEPCAWNFYQRGDFYLRRGQYDKALADYKRAVEFKPSYEFLDLPKDFEEPVNEQRLISCTKQLEREPNTVLTFFERGNAYFAMGKYAQAIDDYSKAMDFSIRTCCQKRGKAYCELKRYDEAIKDFRRAIETEEYLTDELYFDCGLACLEGGRYEDAVHSFNEVILINPNDAAAHYNRGEAYFNLRKYEAAKRDFDKYIRFEPKDPDGYKMRGKCYRALGDTSRAQADFARVGISGRRLF